MALLLKANSRPLFSLLLERQDYILTIKLLWKIRFLVMKDYSAVLKIPMEKLKISSQLKKTVLYIWEEIFTIRVEVVYLLIAQRLLMKYKSKMRIFG
nr:MAG TPA: hypothetical protein [Caudoviricetes sp.]